MRRNRLALLPFAALLVCRGAAAQTPSGAGCTAVGADSARADSAAVDVVVRASVTADELLFRTRPQATLQLPGCAAGAGLRVLERRNLPAQVQPGVTYRDVQVSVEILGRLNAACIAALAGDSAAARGLAPGACELQPRRLAPASPP